MTHQASSVLIAGAGPTGLSAALALAQAGIPIRIIDRLAEPTSQSRAAIVHARTLEHFERLGVVEDFLEEGIRVHGGSVYDTNKVLLLRPNFDQIASAYNFMLGLDQASTERILTKRLQGLNGEVDRGVELVGFEDHGDRVSVHLRNADGSESRQDYAYLVGCDGARSAVRGGLGLHLEGETLDTTWITADVKMQWEFPHDEMVVLLSTDGLVFAAPMNGDRWRLVIGGPKLTPEEAAKVTVNDVQQAVSKRLGIDVPIYDCIWVSPFNVNTRMTPTMQRGRVFLAGDASHVHSPVGGQGMNTGIQDALNLAWKLALVLRGQATQELLDSYNAERHANAKDLILRIGTATKFVSLRNPVGMAVRNRIVHTLGELGLGKFMPGIASMLKIGYRHSPVVEEAHRHWMSHGPKAGSRAPDAEGLLTSESDEPKRLFELWKGDSRHQLIYFGLNLPSELQSTTLYQTIQISKDGKPAPGRVIDADSIAHEVYDVRTEGEYYLVRPDGIVGFHSGEPDPAALRKYLAKFYA